MQKEMKKLTYKNNKISMYIFNFNFNFKVAC